MLELVILFSFFVNSDCAGKLKLGRVDVDVWILSDVVGRFFGVGFGGFVVVFVCFVEYVRD